MSREPAGPGQEPLLDAHPGEALAPAGGPRRALGRDPLEEAGGPDPLLERLPAARGGGGSLRAPAQRTPRRRPSGTGSGRPAAERRSSGTPFRAPPRDPLDAQPETGSVLGRLSGVDRRRWDALSHLVEDERSYDAFGLSPEALRKALPAVHALYRYWFRVRSEGHEHIPVDGPAILAANHGGLLPFDGAMGILDVFLNTDPPRLPRALVDRFAGRLPFVNVLFARLGQVTASRENFRDLLAREQLVWIFPEGIEGIRKPVAQRYRLQHFHEGFAEEALRARVPIVPVAILGAEDQAPVLYDMQPLARRLGLPAAPITPTFPWLGPLGLLPYPVRYRILYGPVFHPAEHFGPEAAEDPRAVAALATRIRSTIQHMVDRNRR